MCAAPLVYGSGMRKLSTVDDFGLYGSGLEQMYQEVILEASKDPHGKAHFAQDITSAQSENEGDGGVHGRAAASAVLTASHEYCVPAQSHQFNPTCGDEVTVRIELSDGSDGKPVRIESLFHGMGRDALYRRQACRSCMTWSRAKHLKRLWSWMPYSMS